MGVSDINAMGKVISGIMLVPMAVAAIQSLPRRTRTNQCRQRGCGWGRRSQRNSVIGDPFTRSPRRTWKVCVGNLKAGKESFRISS